MVDVSQIAPVFIALVSAVAPVVPYGSVAVAVCSLITSQIPAPAPQSPLSPVWRVLNWVALNVKYAKNATPPV
jgi:hypothetical protein